MPALIQLAVHIEMDPASFTKKIRKFGTKIQVQTYQVVLYVNELHVVTNVFWIPPYSTDVETDCHHFLGGIEMGKAEQCIFYHCSSN